MGGKEWVGTDTKARRNEAENAEIRRTSHLATVGQAAAQAWDSGREFHVVELSHGGQTAGYVEGAKTATGDDVGGALQVIEAVGWKLEQAGYVYRNLIHQSTILTDTARITGDIIGVYTFRRPVAIPPPPRY